MGGLQPPILLRYLHRTLSPGDPRTRINSSDAVPRSWLETNYYSKTDAGDGSNYVHKSGGTTSDNPDMDQHKLINILAPTSNLEAANKCYVDDAISESADLRHHSVSIRMVCRMQKKHRLRKNSLGNQILSTWGRTSESQKLS